MHLQRMASRRMLAAHVPAFVCSAACMLDVGGSGGVSVPIVSRSENKHTPTQVVDKLANRSHTPAWLLQCTTAWHRSACRTAAKRRLETGCGACSSLHTAEQTVPRSSLRRRCMP
ncbi:hypothetical protein COO60DRAFT_328179 [Scenedesmus sp. NREL 46B-D3]|nr:hypothetical protein COO60DRAFT_328179 [Scenedesmus sp. NREL 46B-D3]